VVRGVRRGDDDVGAGQLGGQIVDPDGLASEPLGQRDCALVAAVRDEDGILATRREGARGELGSLPGSDQQDAPLGEVAEVPLCELHRDRGN